MIFLTFTTSTSRAENTSTCFPPPLTNRKPTAEIPQMTMSAQQMSRPILTLLIFVVLLTIKQVIYSVIEATKQKASDVQHHANTVGISSIKSLRDFLYMRLPTRKPIPMKRSHMAKLIMSLFMDLSLLLLQRRPSRLGI